MGDPNVGGGWQARWPSGRGGRLCCGSEQKCPLAGATAGSGGGGVGRTEAEVAIVAAALKFWSVVRLAFERGGAHGGTGAEFGIPLGQARAAGEEVIDAPEL